MDNLTLAVEPASALEPITSEQELVRIEGGGPFDELIKQGIKEAAKYLLQHWQEIENGYLSVRCDH
ncbi:MAG: hypothetical protein M3081_03715 [Gemmatimonadota bacterium]|nr:hypothetical protein [Gemmatimonadota bacterium]